MTHAKAVIRINLLIYIVFIRFYDAVKSGRVRQSELIGAARSENRMT
jgi:hypothetical protein